MEPQATAPAPAAIEPAYKHLGWKTYWIFVSERSKIAAGIGLLTVLLTFFPRSHQMNLLVAGFAGVFVLALIITLLICVLEYHHWTYLLDEDALRIRRGLLRREEIAIPYRQIQSADIERNILNQLTGTCSLLILTAGHSDDQKDKPHTEGVIPVIDRTLALSLQSEISKRANIQKVVEV